MMPLMKNDEEITTVKQKILLAAHDLFYSTGFRATGVDKIIKHAKVTKVTFYRYYPAKSTLIMAYLQYRHEMWINWFYTALSNKINEITTPAEALSATMNEWFSSDLFRGCAFINATAEAESEEISNEIKNICRVHKLEAQKVIASLINISEENATSEIMMLIDGAIIHAQMGMDKEEVINQLKRGLERLFSVM